MLLFILLRICCILLFFRGDDGLLVNSSCTDHRYGNPGKTCKKVKDAKFQIRGSGIKIVPMWEYLLLNENKSKRHKRSVDFNSTSVRRSHLIRHPLPIAPPRLNQIIFPRRMHDNEQHQVEPAPIYSMHIDAGRHERVELSRSRKIKRQEAYPTAPPEEEETTTTSTTTRKKCRKCKKTSKENIVKELIEEQEKVIEKALNIRPISKKTEVNPTDVEPEGQGKTLEDETDDNHEVVMKILEAQGKIIEELKDKDKETNPAVDEILKAQGKILESIGDAKQTDEEREKSQAVGQILEAREKIIETLKNGSEPKKNEKKEEIETILDAREKVLGSLAGANIAGDIVEAQEKILKGALGVHGDEDEKDKKAVVGDIIQAQEKILKQALDVSNDKEAKEKEDVVKSIVKAQEKVLKTALEAAAKESDELLETQEKILKGALKIRTEEEEGEEEEDEEEEKKDKKKKKEEEEEEEKEEEEKEEEDSEDEEEKKKKEREKNKGKKRKEQEKKEEKERKAKDKEVQAGLEIKEYLDRQIYNSKMKIPVIRGKAIVNTTTMSPEKSEWSPNIRDDVEPTKYADKPNIKYSYPPKDTLPLQNCFHNPSGYVCCNLELNNVIESTYKEIREDPTFNPCNLQVVANKVQRATEKMFDHPFETVVSHGDFAQNVNFAGDLVCKLEVDGKFLIAYGTPYKADEAVGPEGPDGVPLPTTRFRL